MYKLTSYIDQRCNNRVRASIVLSMQNKHCVIPDPMRVVNNLNQIICVELIITFIAVELCTEFISAEIIRGQICATKMTNF